MSKPLVDIIIPCYNQGHFLGQAIDSALSQTYESVRITVVDDGSTDGTSRIVASYGGKVGYVYQTNKGPSAARNRGLRQTSGTYVCFLDADDVILPSKTADQVSYLENQAEVGIVHGKTLLIEGTKVDVPYPEGRPYKQWEDYLDPLSIMCPFAIHSALVRRSVFNDHGFFSEDTRDRCEDWAYWLKCVLGGVRIAYMPHVHALYRQHEGSVTTNVEALAVNEARFMRHCVALFRESGSLNERRCRLLSTGVRFIGIRCLVVGMIDEFKELVDLSNSLTSAVCQGEPSKDPFNSRSWIPVELLYLSIGDDLFGLGHHELALFSLIHCDDFTMLRALASAYGMSQTCQRVLKNAEEILLERESRVEHTPLPSQTIPERSRDLTNWLDHVKRSIPEQSSFESYLFCRLACLKESLGLIDAAERYFRIAIHFYPYFSSAYSGLGRVLGKMGKLKEAEQALRSAIALEPDSIEAEFRLLRLLIRRGCYAQAFSHIKRMTKESPLGYCNYVRKEAGRAGSLLLGTRYLAARVVFDQKVRCHGLLWAIVSSLKSDRV